MKRKDKLQLWKKESSKQWHWRLRNGYNGKIVTSGEPNGYYRKSEAIAGWKRVVKAAGGTDMGNVILVEL